MLAILILILRVLLLLALLSFLAWAVYTLWRELKFHTESLAAKKIPWISVFSEQESADQKQIFTKPELRIGRDPSCEIRLDDDTVSTQHARLSYRNKQWWIEDLLSTNGTFLNDERVETPTILINEDEIRVGKVLLIVEIQPLV
ncbi:MAG TPA: FHA domain-containing protein [Anaerolineaceae bacterium]|nr:FHA domain-containing protein [Anaerolineaceae bacterium]